MIIITDFIFRCVTCPVENWESLPFLEHTLMLFLFVDFCNSYFGVCFWGSLGFLAIWVTLAAVWKIIWHLYSRLIGIFYETRACWKQQIKQQHWETLVCFCVPCLSDSKTVCLFVRQSGSPGNDTRTQDQRKKINLMSKTCNKLQWNSLVESPFFLNNL